LVGDTGLSDIKWKASFRREGVQVKYSVNICFFVLNLTGPRIVSLLHFPEEFIALKLEGITDELTIVRMGTRDVVTEERACLIGTAAMDAVVIMENSITGQPLDTSFVLFGSCAQSRLCKSKL
jgi:hypothetical protein